jgi:hypothetical protein
MSISVHLCYEDEMPVSEINCWSGVRADGIAFGIRHCEERDEAIQDRGTSPILDRFAALAMTAENDDFIRSDSVRYIGP